MIAINEVRVGDEVIVVLAVNERGEETYNVPGKVISWPDNGDRQRPRVVKCGNQSVEIGHYLAVWRTIK